MAYGHYDTITYDDVLASAKRRLKITNTTDHDTELEDYIQEAVGGMYNKASLIPASCVKEIDSNRIKLPRGFVHLIGARFIESVDSVDQEETVVSKAINYSATYVNYKWMLDCNVPSNLYSGCENSDNYFKEVDGYLVWQYNVESSFNRVQIMFVSASKDEYGRPLLYERYIRAVRSYACGMFAQTYPDKYSSLFVQNEMATWRAQKNFIIGHENEKDWQDNKAEMQRILHTMFIDSLNR